MDRLVRRLRASAPEASEALRIVAYFDVLISRNAGFDSLLRGAAMLSGTVAGATFRGRTMRRDPGGEPLSDAPDLHFSSERTGDTWRVWLEREGEAEPGDEVILERVALGFELLESQRLPTRSLEVALDAAHPRSERLAALARHHVDVTKPLRVLATPPEQPSPTGASAIIPTRYGLVRATLNTTDRVQHHGRVGIGSWERPDDAPASWNAAVIALHLTGDESATVLDATELGAMLQLVQAYDPRDPHPDVRTLATLDDQSQEVLLALVESESVRSAAARLGMHHSTVQARHEALTRTLGYDPRSNLGRMRYIAAALLLRFTDPIPTSNRAEE